MKAWVAAAEQGGVQFQREAQSPAQDRDQARGRIAPLDALI